MLAAALALAACFESEEERAVEAYQGRDYAAAHALSQRLASEDNARGHELLALMAAQGLGAPVDLDAALDHIDRAVALDPDYASSREALRDLIEARGEAARDAFEAGEFARAGALAAPLAAWGDGEAVRLRDALALGQYVALPGSEMAWREFFERCSGNTRPEGDGADAAFAAGCAGRTVVWDGTVAGRGAGTVLVRMEPGRRRARPDHELALAPAAEPAASAGAKIRFRGVVAGRGDAARPDRLEAVEVIGPAPLTPAEEAQAQTRERQTVIQYCRKLIDRDFRDRHAPAWTDELTRRLTEDERRRQRFYTFIAIDSAPAAFVREGDGSWQARIEGRARIQSHNHQTASTSDFVVRCRIDTDHATRPRTTPPGTVAFEWLSDARFDN